jgi:putative aminopeptidase FrvX
MLNQLYRILEQLVLLHSPSGEEGEIDQFLLQAFPTAQRVWRDEAGNIIAHFPGADARKSIAITAHKDEIGMVVHRLEANGQLRIGRLGGSFPWVYGEGVVDILGQVRVVPGILSFGARHVSHQSAHKAQQEDQPLKWEQVWVETFLSREELTAAGIQPGTRVVIGRHRKQPLRIGDRVASYALDNKAALALLIQLADLGLKPRWDTYFVCSAQEEIGALGALYFTQRTQIDELIALEVAPVAAEYPIVFDDAPVLLAADAYSYYSLELNRRIEQRAQEHGISLQSVILSGFGSDATLCVKTGHVAQVACLGFPTLNTHGFEVTSLGALVQLIQVLQAYLHD